MKPSDKQVPGKEQPPEKDLKDKVKVVVPKGKHAFECGGNFVF
jgi:hypothetical protein